MKTRYIVYTISHRKYNGIKMTSNLTDHILWYTVKWDISGIKKEIEKIILSL
jgi:hypothetical protein